MANLDTRSKRASSVGILLPFVLAPVLPDATIDAVDRPHIAWSYSGITAAAPDVDGFFIYLVGSVNRTTNLTGSVEDTRSLVGSVNDTVNLTGAV